MDKAVPLLESFVDHDSSANLGAALDSKAIYVMGSNLFFSQVCAYREFGTLKDACGPGGPQGQPGYHPNEYKSFVGGPGEPGATGFRDL